jgi:hypothetical protein
VALDGLPGAHSSFARFSPKNPPPPFVNWTWESQRKLAIKGKDEEFRRAMVEAYAAMKRSDSDDFFAGLPTGAVIYAERVRAKDGSRTAKTLSGFPSMGDYLVSLHSAIFIQAITDEVLRKLPVGIVCLNAGSAIWHATSIEGGTCLWPLEKFLLYYKPLAAKSFIREVLDDSGLAACQNA